MVPITVVAGGGGKGYRVIKWSSESEEDLFGGGRGSAVAYWDIRWMGVWPEFNGNPRGSMEGWERGSQ